MGAGRTRRVLMCVGLIAVIGAVLPAPASAAQLTAGNLLVAPAHGSTVYEYTRQGTLVQSIAVPYPADVRPNSESVRDIVSIGTTEIVVYNGTFTPYLSAYDPGSEVWTHRTHPGWHTVSNATYGGLAALGSFVYATSLRCCGEPSGIVRFDRSDSTSITFHPELRFIDLTLGQDGLLYALHDSERSVRVFDPHTMEFLRFIPLGAPGVRGIAVDEAGHIYAASEDSFIYHFDANGALLASVLSGGGFLGDIDISAARDLVVGAEAGRVLLTDTTLTDLDSFVGGSDRPFLSFIEADANRPPDCSGATASPAELRVAKHRLVPVAPAGVTDPDGDAVELTVTGVTQDEPTRGRSSGELAPDAHAAATADGVLLRGERDARGDGRVYRIAFTAADAAGATCNGSVNVGVRRRAAQPAVDSAPPSYDSFGR